jgi:general secretion pathway protein K
MSAQRGVALVTVLLIVAMATTTMAFMAQQQAFWQRETGSGRDRVQAAYIAQAGVDWARALLADDASNNRHDHAREMWAVRLPSIPVEGGEVTGGVEEQQGMFNLNNMVRNGATSLPDVVRFRRLLATLGLPQELAYTLADWMDADDLPEALGGAEGGYYLNLPRPYRAANMPLAELSELLWVRGFDAHVLLRLKGYVTVLPQRTAINVNFATAEVLSAVVDDLPMPQARQIVSRRKEVPFKSVAEFAEQLPHGTGGNSRGEIGVSSQFFMVDARASLGQGEYRVRTLLHRREIWSEVVRQSVQ